jgi:hypothetical protein
LSAARSGAAIAGEDGVDPRKPVLGGMMEMRSGSHYRSVGVPGIVRCGCKRLHVHSSIHYAENKHWRILLHAFSVAGPVPFGDGVAMYRCHYWPELAEMRHFFGSAIVTTD